MNNQIAQNFMLQQMPLTSTPRSGNAGSKDTAGNFQDLMDQAAQDTSVDTGRDAGTTEKPVQSENDAKTETKTPDQKKPVEDEENPAELHGDPNAVNYALDLFRPEIVDISEPEIAIEAPAELTATAETAAEAPEAEMPILETETEMETAPEEAPVPETAPQFKEIAVEREAPKTAEAVQEQAAEERPVETTERPTEIQQEAPVEDVEKTTETGELRDVRPADEAEKPEDEVPEEAVEQQNPQQIFHDVKATPVKVGETYQAVDTQEPEMDGKLAATILESLENGAESIQIQLAPANLGALTIQMTRDVSGALQVVLHASNPRAAAILGQHLDGLHTALQTYGNNQPVHVEVQRNNESQEQHMFQQANPDGHGQRQNREQEKAREDEESGEDFMQKLRLGLTALEE